MVEDQVVDRSDRNAEIEHQLARLAAAGTSTAKVDVKIRKSAVFYLGELLSDGESDSSNAVVALRTAATSDSSDVVRSFAIWALKTAGTELDVSAVQSASEDTSANVRVALADFLADFETEGAVRTLRRLADDEIASVRIHAVQAFPKFGDSSREFFVNKLQDPDRLVRFWATRALEEIGDRDAAAALQLRSSEVGWWERRRMRAAASAIAARIRTGTE